MDIQHTFQISEIVFGYREKLQKVREKYFAIASYHRILTTLPCDDVELKWSNMDQSEMVTTIRQWCRRLRACNQADGYFRYYF